MTSLPAAVPTVCTWAAVDSAPSPRACAQPLLSKTLLLRPERDFDRLHNKATHPAHALMLQTEFGKLPGSCPGSKPVRCSAATAAALARAPMRHSRAGPRRARPARRRPQCTAMPGTPARPCGPCGPGSSCARATCKKFAGRTWSQDLDVRHSSSVVARLLSTQLLSTLTQRLQLPRQRANQSSHHLTLVRHVQC